jgi:hypothetical protein
MAKKDSLSRGLRYKAVRNRVTALVRRDKEMSNLAKLSESKSSPAVLWEIANAAVGKLRQPLPAFMKANNILTTSQHGFRKGRSCTTALARAHAAWVSAKAKVVAVIGFDLSAAFDTVGREDLLLKMLAMGIGGKALKWFRCYLTNAKQRVVWDGLVSDVVDVEYGVRQGSLLGPVRYLLHVFNLPLTLEIRESDGDSGYANKTAVWVERGAGIGAGCHQRRGQVRRRTQEGRSHPDRGPAGGGKVPVAQPAGGPSQGHGRLERLRE